MDLKNIAEVNDIVLFFAVLTTVSGACLLFRKLALNMLKRWAEKTETKVDDIILATIRHPSIYWSLAIGLYMAVGLSSFPTKFVDYTLKSLYILIIFSATLVLANLISRLTQYAIESRELPLPATGLSRTIIKAVVLTVGIHILVERPIRVGDYIKLSSGEEGYVMDIGWRTTRIRMLANNVIIVPNNKLSQSIITNYYYPEKRMSLLIPIGVSYDSDPDRVEKILVQEAQKAAGEIAGFLKEPPPFVRFIPGFGDSSLNFTLICQIAEYVDQYLVQHELRKRIFKRFKEEGIEIPFPIRTVYLKQTKEQI